MTMLFLLPSRGNQSFGAIPLGLRRYGYSELFLLSEMYMEWIMLLLAGISEITWAYCMKLSDGFTKFVPSAVTVVFYILSAVFLSQALRKIPLGTAYAMWTGFGIVGTSLLGVLFFNEVLSTAQVICIALIVCGIVGLKIL
jgi:quaternary ammonium compound-resistance protein SugE